MARRDARSRDSRSSGQVPQGRISRERGTAVRWPMFISAFARVCVVVVVAVAPVHSADSRDNERR